MSEGLSLHSMVEHGMRPGDVFTMDGVVAGSWWSRLLYRLHLGPQPRLKRFVVARVAGDLAYYEEVAGESEDPPAVTG